MKTTTEKTSPILNDLIQINNDRIAGYERALKETDPKDADLGSLFEDFAAESRSYVTELTRLVAQDGNEPADGTTVRGKIYRAWMDVKATFSGSGRKAILASCEFGEDAAQKAYKDALDDASELTEEARNLVMTQQQKLKKSHDRVKKLRDTQPA